MREYKFRGKKIDSPGYGNWRYGSLIGNTIAYRYSFGWDEDIIDPKTVGQFTGLYDSEGKEIYEGDILGITGVRFVFKVEWGNELCLFKLIILRPMNSFYWGALGKDSVDSLGLKVIGNIHENPQLLEVTK